MLLSTIIITFNTREMTLECLRTLLADTQRIDHEIFIVDNASTDGTLDAIRKEFPQVRLIANTQNKGFGAANNQAMKIATGKYFLLLNSDAFPKPGAIPTLIKELESQPDVALLGPKLLNPDGSLQLSCFKFPSPTRAWLENTWLSTLFSRNQILGDYRCWPRDAPHHVDWLIGACMLLRRDVFEKIGGFDERFFMYAEETDWQLRMQNAGYHIALTPAAQAMHLAGASTDPAQPKKEKSLINEHFFHSLDLYALKHHGHLGLLGLRAAMITGTLLRFPLYLAALLSPNHRPRAKKKLQLHRWLLQRQLITPPPKSPPPKPTASMPWAPCAAAPLGIPEPQSTASH